VFGPTQLLFNRQPFELQSTEHSSLSAVGFGFGFNRLGYKDLILRQRLQLTIDDLEALLSTAWCPLESVVDGLGTESTVCIKVSALSLTVGINDSTILTR